MLERVSRVSGMERMGGVGGVDCICGEGASSNQGITAGELRCIVGKGIQVILINRVSRTFVFR